MQSKDYLKEYGKYRLKEQIYEAQLDVLKQFKGRCDPVRANIQKEIQKARKRQINVLESISALSDPVSQQILTMRYISGLKWEQIAEQLNYSTARVYDLHRKALEELKIPERKEKNDRKRTD